MQEREDVHRGEGRLGRRSLAACAVALLVVSSAPARGGIPMTAIGPDALGAPAFRIPVPPGEERFTGALVSFSNPYMLDGLSTEDLLAGVRSRSWSVWTGWHHLGHALYREDRLELGVGSMLPIASVEWSAAAAVERSVVRGFPAEGRGSLRAGLGWSPTGALEISIAGAPLSEDGRDGRAAAGALAIRAADVAIFVATGLAGPETGDTKVVLVAELGGRAAVISGYRSTSDELLAGLVVRCRPMLFILGWSYNPALGKTLSAGVGRWKAW